MSETQLHAAKDLGEVRGIYATVSYIETQIWLSLVARMRGYTVRAFEPLHYPGVQVPVVLSLTCFVLMDSLD